ncbi:hypothetical protein AVEN_142450-1, partial [Araneus ventricosus]
DRDYYFALFLCGKSLNQGFVSTSSYTKAGVFSKVLLQLVRCCLRRTSTKGTWTEAAGYNGAIASLVEYHTPPISKAVHRFKEVVT